MPKQQIQWEDWPEGGLDDAVGVFHIFGVAGTELTIRVEGESRIVHAGEALAIDGQDYMVGSGDYFVGTLPKQRGIYNANHGGLFRISEDGEVKAPCGTVIAAYFAEHLALAVLKALAEKHGVEYTINADTDLSEFER